MSNTLEKLQQKYSLPEACGPGGTDTDRRAAGWRNVPEIRALREYLDAHPQLGARIGRWGQTGLIMRFSPPIGIDDGGKRMRAAFEAGALLIDAKPAILRLVATGEIRMRRFE
jgi:hypothetical protein